MTEPATVLVVEDERNLADLFGTWLEGEYDVRVSYTGEDALEEFDDGVDVVLLDRRMPDISGDEILKEINQSVHECQVAMVTGVDPDFDIV
ncbi:MAG: response regulator transcription factor, partial [Halobacteriaceae archaeon]